MNRILGLSLLIVLLGVQLSSCRRVVQSITDLNHTEQLPQQLCSDSRVCKTGHCDIVPKNISVQREVENVLEAKDDKKGWTCVEMETVDGICENEKMQKAELRHKIVSMMRNPSVCHSKQSVVIRLADRQKLSYELHNDRSLNDACRAIHIDDRAAKYDCSKIVQNSDVEVDYMVGGYSQKVNVKSQAVRNLEVSAANNVVNATAKLQNMNSRAINATIKGKSINLTPAQLAGLQLQLNKDTQMYVEKQFVEDNAMNFINDHLSINMNGKNMGLKNQDVVLNNNEKCKSNSLCKVSNCDRVQKSKQVLKTETRWFRGFSWYTRPSSGWTCRKNYFSGCYADRSYYVTETYYADRNSICTQNVQTSVKIRPTADIKLSAQSLLDACKTISGNKASCEIVASVDYVMDVKAGNNVEEVKSNFVTNIVFKLINVNTKSPTIDQNSIMMLNPFSNHVTKHPSLFKEPRYNFHKRVENQIVDFVGNSTKYHIMMIAGKMSAMQSGVMSAQNVAYNGAFVNSSNVTIGNEACRTNPVCAQNCEYVPVNQTYSVNVTRTVAEANQSNHEMHGWNCVKTLNNVSRCADNVYKKNFTFIETIQEEAEPEVCHSNVTGSVTLQQIDINQVEIKSIAENCEQDESDEKQVLVCQSVHGSASWNYTLSIGGNDATFTVVSDLKTSVEVSVSHNLMEDDVQQANFDIRQSEVDDEVLDNLVDGRHNHVDEEEQWFDNMADLVRAKIRSQIFATVLEHVRIKNNRVTFE